MKKAQNKPGSLTGFFFKGLVTLLPVGLTLVVFGLLFQMVNRYVTGPINAVIYWSLERNAVGWQALGWIGIDPLASDYLATELLPVDLQSLASTSPEGVLLSLLLVLWLGWLVGGFVGRRFMQHVDRTMTLIPVVKSVYPHSKQLVEFFFEKKKLEFDTVVAVPYPSEGFWAIAFVTNGSLRSLDEATGKELLAVFLPSSPMPMTGWTVFVDSKRVVRLPLTVDEAVRIIMTGGVLLPPQELVARSLTGAKPPMPVPLTPPAKETA
ncbi:MAG: DUF502 domain-containing protein [Planctomycetota bacterium]